MQHRVTRTCLRDSAVYLVHAPKPLGSHVATASGNNAPPLGTLLFRKNSTVVDVVDSGISEVFDGLLVCLSHLLPEAAEIDIAGPPVTLVSDRVETFGFAVGLFACEEIIFAWPGGDREVDVCSSVGFGHECMVIDHMS